MSIYALKGGEVKKNITSSINTKDIIFKNDFQSILVPTHHHMNVL